MNEQLTVAIVGMGPRGLSVLERLAVRLMAAAAQGDRRAVRIYTIDPGEHGAGRIWRTDQPEQLIMNTAAVEVSLFSGEPDDGPWRPGAGPSLHEWLAAQAAAAGEPEPSPNTYSPRRVYGNYLREVYRSVLANLPEGSEIQEVTGWVQRIQRDGDGSYLLGLDGDREIRTDRVVLTTGHPHTRSGDADLELLDFASRHRRTRYLRGDSAADMDLDGIEAGENVAIIGLGLTFYDVTSLLTLGRGGRYETGADGVLRYLPSGREPHIVASSRSGLPLLARGRNQKSARHRYQPRFFTSEAIEALRAAAVVETGNVQLRFREHLLPLVQRELEYVYFTTYVRNRDGAQAAADFAECYTAASDPDALAQLLTDTGLDALPRLNLQAMARPFVGRHFTHPNRFRSELIRVLRADAAAAQEGNLDGPVKAALDTLRDVRSVMRQAVEFSSLHPDSHRQDFLGWFVPINTMLSAGPPGLRIEQTIALIEAGVLTVIGPSLQVGSDESAGWFVLSSPRVDDSKTTARILIDARIPRSSVHVDASPLTRQLVSDGLASAHVNINPVDGTRFTTGALAVTKEPAFCVVDAAGRPSRSLYALGIPTEELRWFTQIGNGRPGSLTGFHSDADEIVAQLLDPQRRRVARTPGAPAPQPAAIHVQ